VGFEKSFSNSQVPIIFCTNNSSTRLRSELRRMIDALIYRFRHTDPKSSFTTPILIAELSAKLTYKSIFSMANSHIDNINCELAVFTTPRAVSRNVYIAFTNEDVIFGNGVMLKACLDENIAAGPRGRRQFSLQNRPS